MAWTPLICTSCGETVEVMEIPAGHLDPERFMCIPCLSRRHEEREEKRRVKDGTVSVPFNEFPPGF